jgi:glycosyltransferase involved in cell wall biosynthesis
MPDLTLPFPRVSPAAAPAVLHVRVVCGHGGGPDKNILRATRYTDPARFRLAAAYLHPPHDRGIHVLRFEAEDAGMPFHAIPDTGPADPRSALAALQLCKALRVGVWHAHDYKSNFLGLILRCFWPMKLVTTMHGWTNETLRTRFYYRIDRQCIVRYDRVITVGPALHRACAEMAVPPQRETYLPNGIDLDEYTRRAPVAQRRRELGVPADRLVVGVVARLSAEKGVDRAVRALAGLRVRYPNCELHILGAGREQAHLQALCASLGLASAVRFWGWQRRPQPYYEMMDMLLLPSLTEGMPNAVLEAMAMGVPVAATDVGGVRELLDDGRAGVVLGSDEAAWPAQVQPLLDSPAYRGILAQRAHARVAQRYSYRRWVERVNAVYTEVLGLTEAAVPLRRAA